MTRPEAPVPVGGAADPASERTAALPLAEQPGTTAGAVRVDRPPLADGPGRQAPRPRSVPRLPSEAAAGAPAPGAAPGSAATGTSPTPPRTPRPAAAPAASGTRRARLAVRRVHPWSVFVLSLLASLFVGLAVLVSVFVLYTVLEGAGVQDSVNELYAEVTREPGGADPAPLLTRGRVLGVTGLLAALDVVLLTVLATLGAVLYNVCASVTGGVEVTLAEGD